MLDNPCKSPDCPPERALSPSGAKASVRTLWLLACFLGARAGFAAVFFLAAIFVLAAVLFGVAFFLANLFLGVARFLASFFGAFFFGAFFFDFASFFFIAIGAVYHRTGHPDRKIAR